MEHPVSDRIHFTIMDSNWMDGLARAMQEALARLCGQSVHLSQGTRYSHYVRHDAEGVPLTMPLHPTLRNHAEHLDFMLYETRKELDISRIRANQAHLAKEVHVEAIKMLESDRKSLRLQRYKQERTISHLHLKIASLEETVK
jgi:hypothetical protein